VPGSPPALPPLTVVLLGGPTEDSLMEDVRALGPIRSVHYPPGRQDQP